MRFSDLGLSSSILEALTKKGYSKPSPIQEKAIPIVLQGKDLMAAAQTGTGKTAGFTLPILQLLNNGKKVKSNHVRALIVTPTRELAAQIDENVKTYGENLPLRNTVVFGGVKINPQMMRLRKGMDILVATPGRLLDLYNQNAVKFNQLDILVLDEADRMLDMGFIHDIKKLISFLPKKRQTLMFSATFSPDIRALAKTLVNNASEVSVSPQITTAEKVKQWIVPVDKKQKTKLLIHLIKEKQWHQILVFSRTKHGANKIVKLLDQAEIKAAAIHGNKSQGARTKALASFKDSKIQVLVATDIAARGIDIQQLPYVVNFDLPNVPADYVHRIGRTGRAGSSGEALSLVCADEVDQLRDIERLIKTLLVREFVDGFEPVHDVPITVLNTKPFKAKRPKKPKVGHKDGQRSRSHSGNRKNNSKAGSKSNNSGRNKYKGKQVKKA